MLVESGKSKVEARGWRGRSEEVVVVGPFALGLAPDGIGVEDKRIDERLGIDDGACGGVLGVVEVWFGGAVQEEEHGMRGLQCAAHGEGCDEGDGDGGELGGEGEIVVVGDGDAHHDTSASAACT